VELYDGDRIVYALPRVAIYYAFRCRMTAGLDMGRVKG
jgi:hypothetical protein